MVFDEKYKNASWNKRMEALRVLSGMSRGELAEKIGTSSHIYNNWANARFTPIRTNRKAIARALGVPEEEIFGDKLSRR